MGMVLPSRDESGVPEFELVETARYELRALSDSLLELGSQHMVPGLALPGGLAPVPGQGDGMGQIVRKVRRGSYPQGDVYVHVRWAIGSPPTLITNSSALRLSPKVDAAGRPDWRRHG
jgi:hypothetical protein